MFALYRTDIKRVCIFSLMMFVTCARNTVTNESSNTFTQIRAISVSALSQAGTVICF